MKYKVEYLKRYTSRKLVAEIIHEQNPKVAKVRFDLSNYYEQKTAWEELKATLRSEGIDLVVVDHYNNSQESGIGEAISWLYKITLIHDTFIVVKDWRSENSYIVINRDWVNQNIENPNVYTLDKNGRFVREIAQSG